MAERILGQLSLADGLVAGIAESVLDDIAAGVDWPALAAVLGSRNGAGPGSPGYPSLRLLRCLLLGVWPDLSDPALEPAIQDRLSFPRLTGLSLHDPGPGDASICGAGPAVYGDQAYYTPARHARLREAGLRDRLMRRPNKHHPTLSARHKRRNRRIGRIRSGVERPFAMLKER